MYIEMNDEPLHLAFFSSIVFSSCRKRILRGTSATHCQTSRLAPLFPDTKVANGGSCDLTLCVRYHVCSTTA